MNMRYNHAKKNTRRNRTQSIFDHLHEIYDKTNLREEISCNKNAECCKQPLCISFEEIGWDDWIIYPKGFNANYCVGKCSSPYLMMHAQASFLIKEYKFSSENRLISRCCRMSSLKMLVINYENRVITKKLPQMIVEECGCLF
ncbi:Transforming growth factor beta like domain containing protein-like protein [Dinothrombium tinctorium]|uniref:Transforming growth factor beta like domain containing protein-like protein n=1 Tax=Dinothrombium tinctorium TaxID=1965070 RepID=A0A3S3RJK4_9ACAR|nr:Transforming growth factor beta like domain containing protein-like protein [Dinothrombium tinctorium]RWS02315.1 Transforming growth factor beta like domain containing protein-like protein [Dinothrombium tinctorium]RWS02483.1 Transforming growth factor beta like domain containing protein-like protein [Dinothrombium tinctorium]